MQQLEEISKKQGLNIVLLGNPGVGKSTLSTTLSGKPFKSGMSFGAGLTAELQWHDDGRGWNIKWADTPGLADIKLREQAAEAIMQALKDSQKEKRALKLIFVCFAQAGRIDPLDIKTINDVTEAIRLPGNKKLGPDQYAVIFNKFNQKIFDSDKFKNGGRDQLELYFRVPRSEKYPTSVITETKYIYYQFYKMDLDGAENEKFDETNSSKEELEKLAQIVITSPSIPQIEDVKEIEKKIDEDVIDKINAQHQAQMAMMAQQVTQQLENMNLQRKILEDQLNQSRKDAAAAAEQQRELMKGMMQMSKAPAPVQVPIPIPCSIM